jgi:hypothetical protein
MINNQGTMNREQKSGNNERKTSGKSSLLIKIVGDIFVASLIFLFVLLAAEDIKHGFVSYHLDLRIIFIVVAASGIFCLLTSRRSGESKEDADGRAG